jgi:hypothetical protein
VTILHNALHRHDLAHKPDVGQVHMCTNRITRRMDVEVAPHNDDQVIYVPNATPLMVALFARAVTAAELRDLAEGFSDTPEECRG